MQTLSAANAFTWPDRGTVSTGLSSHHHDEYWAEIPLAAEGPAESVPRAPVPRAFLSLRAAGDLGPSGRSKEALERRAKAFPSLNAELRFLGFESETGKRIDLSSTLCCKQVHSLAIVVIVKGHPCRKVWASWSEDQKLQIQHEDLPFDPGDDDLAERVALTEADGLISDVPGLPLSVTIADCMPIYLSAGRLAGVLHSGWPGTGILSAAQAAVALAGESSMEITSGPFVSWQSYPVPEERAGLFRERFGSDSVKIRSDGQPALDLLAANRNLVNGTAPCLSLDRNVRASIRTWSVCPYDTVENTWLQSYRRDGTSYGRMLALLLH